MNYKWLLVAACVFITACNGAKKDDPQKDKKADSTDTTQTTLEDKTDKDSPNKDTKSNPAEAIAQKFKLEQQEFYAIYRKASDEEKKELMEQAPTPEPYLGEMKQLAKDNPNTEIAATAYVWIASQIRNDDDLVNEAYSKLFEHHVESKKMRGICQNLMYSKPSAIVEQRLNTLIEKSPHDNVKAVATFAKAEFLGEVLAIANIVDEPRMAKYLGEESVEYVKSANVEDSVIEGLYETLVDKYPDVEVYGDQKLGTLAASALFEIRNLKIGCPVPDIEGSDLDGNEFKLSDYRGKVVMLDFWGDW